MNRMQCSIAMLVAIMVLLSTGQGWSSIICPADDIDYYPFGWATGAAKGPEDFDKNGNNVFDNNPENILCFHLAAGDGFATMGDGKELYTFSFSQAPISPLTITAGETTLQRTLKQDLPAPTLVMKQNQKVYLNLTNVGLPMRPDLFDAHSIHFHGFPNAVPVFDGLPEASPTIKMFSTYTYYYETVDPGTYFYHCHVEATEHMQMGMIGNLWVTPAQDGTDYEYPPGSGRNYTRFAYNDGDGSTGYDKEYFIQLTGFDSNFHEKHIAVQPLPFAEMDDDYHMINGRGYPDTINPGEMGASPGNNNYPSQKMHARIEATSGARILLRISSVETVHPTTVTLLGIPMEVVGQGARHLKNGLNKLYYKTAVLNVGGGQGYDVILDTLGVAPGTYFLYSTNPEALVNGPEERGGQMTEIVIN